MLLQNNTNKTEDTVGMAIYKSRVQLYLSAELGFLVNLIQDIVVNHISQEEILSLLKQKIKVTKEYSAELEKQERNLSNSDIGL
jgi:hypothetical protein